jgi:hypothetical protein
MTTTPCGFGFRVLNSKASERRLVDHAAALAGYCACDSRAEVHREAYLSHFVFPSDFREHLERERSEKGYSGPCGASWLFWDIDREDDIGAAQSDARRLAGAVLERYRALDDDDLLLFISGGKGFHVGIPTSLWTPEPSLIFNDIAKRFCSAHAERAGVAIDASNYNKTRLFRAPNSKHPKTGLFKRRLTLDELTYLKPDAIVALAIEPFPFDLPVPTAIGPTAAADWLDAARAVERRTVERRAAGADSTPKLNALTLAFIRDGATEGDRHRTLFSAAANLAEFGCLPALAHALLTQSALDTGLTPSDVRRQIEKGLDHPRRQSEGSAS